MSVISGKSGTVKVGATTIVEVTKWTFEPMNSVPKYASNATAGYKKGVAGVRDSKGTVEVKVDSTGCPWGVGQAVTLVLDASGSAADTITVPAIIATSPTECDINDGAIVGMTYAFEGNGAWIGVGIYANIDVHTP